ncbi:MAG: PqqD family protein [Clostridiales bacterium]|nr:PqqD family protein [Clostridiales bacterium]
MKIREGFVLRQVAGKHVAVAIGPASRILNGMIKLNDTGVFCWNCLLKEMSEEELAAAMSAEYGITQEQAAIDVNGFLDTLRDVGCLEEN